MLKINVLDNLWVYGCPYHGETKEWLTKGDERDSRSCSSLTDARVAKIRAPSMRRSLFLEDH